MREIDCIIVGGGIAGLQAAIQLGRYSAHQILVVDAGRADQPCAEPIITFSVTRMGCRAKNCGTLAGCRLNRQVFL